LAEDAAAKRVVQDSHVTHFEKKHEEEMRAIRVAEQAAEVVQEEYKVHFYDYESPFSRHKRHFCLELEREGTRVLRTCRKSSKHRRCPEEPGLSADSAEGTRKEVSEHIRYVRTVVNGVSGMVLPSKT